MTWPFTHEREGERERGRGGEGEMGRGGEGERERGRGREGERERGREGERERGREGERERVREGERERGREGERERGREGERERGREGERERNTQARWGESWASTTTRLHNFMPTPSNSGQGVGLSRRAWTRLNRLRTEVGRVGACYAGAWPRTISITVVPTTGRPDLHRRPSSLSPSWRRTWPCLAGFKHTSMAGWYWSGHPSGVWWTRKEEKGKTIMQKHKNVLLYF